MKGINWFIVVDNGKSLGQLAIVPSQQYGLKVNYVTTRCVILEDAIRGLLARVGSNEMCPTDS